MAWSWRQLKQRILVSPSWKSLFSAISLVAVGVACSAFVVEITTPAGLAWSSCYKMKTFYMLILIVVILIVYHRLLYSHEKAIDRFRDAEYCIAYMRSQCLPEAAIRYKELIRTGEMDEFKNAMDLVRKILK